jgi:hypothetical protein
MAKAAQAMSAKDFRDPLLKVMGSRTKFDSGRTVNHEDVYDPICVMMGITRNQFGETNGVPWVDKWTQWAFQALRDDDLGVKHGRGKWGLTPAGVDKARALMTSSIATEITPEDEAEMLAGIMPIPQMETDDGMYHPDPYIRSLGLEGHPCMGYFSNQASLCLSCPARMACQNHLITRMSGLVDTLALEDLATGKPRLPVVDQDAKDPEPEKYHPPAGAKINEISNSDNAVCDHCGGDLPKGSPAYWILKLGPDKKGSKLMHLECVEVVEA